MHDNIYRHQNLYSLLSFRCRIIGICNSMQTFIIPYLHWTTSWKDFLSHARPNLMAARLLKWDPPWTGVLLSQSWVGDDRYFIVVAVAARVREKWFHLDTGELVTFCREGFHIEQDSLIAQDHFPRTNSIYSPLSYCFPNQKFVLVVAYIHACWLLLNTDRN